MAIDDYKFPDIYTKITPDQDCQKIWNKLYQQLYSSYCIPKTILQGKSDMNSPKFVEKKLSELKYGDVFWIDNSEYRLINHEDYINVFGEKYPNYGYLNTGNCLVYRRRYNEFCHLPTDVLVKVKQEPVRLGTLPLESDFEYTDSNRDTGKYYIYQIINNRAKCVRLDKKFGNYSRIVSFSFDALVYPIN